MDSDAERQDAERRRLANEGERHRVDGEVPGEVELEVEADDDDAAPDAGNPYRLAVIEPPQRSTGWRHLAPERWTPDRIHVAPYNAKIRKLSPAKRARLQRGLIEFGWAGTFLVRAEDGMLIGGAQRFALALETIEAHAGDLAELERLNLATAGRVSLAVSPVLGIPDAKALALNVLLNNRETQGEFVPMGLAAALSELDAAGFDATDTGYSIEQVASLVTWEAPDEPATVSPKQNPPALVLPFSRADLSVAIGFAQLALDDERAPADARAAIGGAIARLRRALDELPAGVLPDVVLDFADPAPAPSGSVEG